MLMDASFAEVVSTWCCDRFTEHIQTDAAQKLVTGWQMFLSSHAWTQLRVQLTLIITKYRILQHNFLQMTELLVYFLC